VIALKIIEMMVSGRRLHTSLEGENPGGSIKDHLVAGEIAEWARRGELRPGRVLAEASAGSTGRSLAYYARRAGCRCTIFAPRSLPEDKLHGLMADLREAGAELRIEPDNEIFEKLRAYCAAEDALFLNQMANRNNRRHYAQLGREITRQLGKIDALVGAVGTGHSLLGIAEGMQPRPQVVTAEPLDGQIPGVRNIEQVRFGDDDPISPSDFDQRLVVSVKGMPPEIAFESSAGTVHAAQSFGLVMKAAASLLERNPGQQVFLIGAANWRKTIRGDHSR
jgi:cysteine synthase